MPLMKKGEKSKQQISKKEAIFLWQLNTTLLFSAASYLLWIKLHTNKMQRQSGVSFFEGGSRVRYFHQHKVRIPSPSFKRPEWPQKKMVHKKRTRIQVSHFYVKWLKNWSRMWCTTSVKSFEKWLL